MIPLYRNTFNLIKLLIDRLTGEIGEVLFAENADTWSLKLFGVNEEFSDREDEQNLVPLCRKK